MKRVFLCAEGLGQSQKIMKYLLRDGTAPILPQIYELLFPTDSETEQAQMTRAGESLLWLCDEVWVVGEPTPDMARQTRMARMLNLPVRQLKQSEIRRMEENLNE